MDNRQKTILRHFLLKPKETVLVEEIGKIVGVSDKTIRNDFKEIDKWLQSNSTAKLIRKRSKGVYLVASESEKKQLLKEVEISQGETDWSDNKRIFFIFTLILNKSNHVTIQQLAEKFFVSKAIIKKDLKIIEQFLRKHDLQLVTKQRLGIVIEGNEMDRRNALMRFLDYVSFETDKGEMIRDLFQPQEYYFVEKIVKQIDEVLPLSLTEGSLNSVIIHILIAIKRIKLKNQILIQQQELCMIKEKKEYGLAKKLAEKLEPFFVVKFPEMEVAYIALRFLGGKIDYPAYTNDVAAANKVEEDVFTWVERIMLSVSKEVGTDFDLDPYLKNGLAIHLRSTFYRLRHGLTIFNPMVNDIKKMYPYMFQLLYSVVEKNKPFQLVIPEDEIAYLTIHFQSSYERINRLKGEHKRVIIVCSMGIGVSQLLCTKLERRFEHLEIIDCIPASKLEKLTRQDFDFIITTVPLQTSIPNIEISPLLFDYEQQKVELFIKSLDDIKDYKFLRNSIQDEFVFIHLEVADRFDAIKQVNTLLLKNNKVTENYLNSIITREYHSSTAIGGGVAIPHGDPDDVSESTVAVATFKEPIAWGNEKVSIMFLLANNRNLDSKQIKLMFQDLSRLCEDSDFVLKLSKQKNKHEFFQCLAIE